MSAHSAFIRLGTAILGTGLTLSACRAAASAAPPPRTPVPDTLPADTLATQLMYALTGDSSQDQLTAMERILAARDKCFVAVFIELMRANEIGLWHGLGYQTHIAALKALTGQSFGPDWPAWVEWYGATDLAPPPGFTGWKGELLAGIDPAFGDFLREGLPTRIRVEEFQWGGVVVDGISALDNPKMVPAALQLTFFLGNRSSAFRSTAKHALIQSASWTGT